MRTDISAFIMVSENRKKIVRALLGNPDREWSCPGMEDATQLPHATVFRTLAGLKYFGILKTSRVNRKDVVYEVAESPFRQEFERILNIEQITTRQTAQSFVDKVSSEKIFSIILYGSSVRGDIKPDSDIDVLIILNKYDKESEMEIQNIAAELSSQVNKTIATVVMDKKDLLKEINTSFIASIRENMELLYGKNPF